MMKKGNWLFAAAGLLLLVAMVNVCDAQDYTPYTPGPQVRSWATGDLTLSSNLDTLLPYLKQVGYHRVAPFVAVGVIAFFAILIWSCCRCCCNKCHAKLEDGSFCGKVMFIVLLMVMVCSVGLAIGGLKAGKQQNTAFTNFPTILDSVTSYVDEVGAFNDDVAATTTTIIALLTELKDAQYSAFVDSNQIDAMISFVMILADTTNSVDVALSDLNFGSFTSFNDQSQSINDLRDQFTVIVLAVLLGLILLEGLFSILDFCLNGNMRPSHNGCRFITYLVALFTILILLILWLLGGALIAATTVVSDVCLDPDAQFISLLNEQGLQGQGQELTVFFLTCDTDMTLNHPFRTEIYNISSAINQTLTELATTQSDVSQCDGLLGASDPTCLRAHEIVTYLTSNTTLLEQELGTDPSLIDAQGNSSDGFLYLISCMALNGRYQNMLNVFCGDMGEALGLSTGIIVGFALIYLFSQIFTRIVSDVGRDEHSEPKII
eukprot:m.39856 g.39856  ORF g.39856 m.39856 type:complete len:491 (+) comp6890_c1_seq1:57-1529(+)